MSGPFITFEGIDGAGKSTHIGGVAERLRQRAHGAGVAPEDPGRAPGDLPVAERNDDGRPPNMSSARAAEGPRTSLPREVVLTREPGGTELAERLRHLVLHTPMDTLTEVLLVFAARRDHLHRVIVPALARGATVLCDRFTDATFAYQGAGRGFDRDVLQQLETWVHGGLTPDLTFWFDLPPEVAVERLAQARAPDRFEVEGAAFFHRVREGYRARADSHPGRFVRIDAEQDRVAVARQVDAVLSERGW